MKKQKWQVLVIDEAQNIKNSDTAQSKAIHSIPANCHNRYEWYTGGESLVGILEYH
jgi:SNF2 family DNA or RNA helicase